MIKNVLRLPSRPVNADLVSCDTYKSFCCYAEEHVYEVVLVKISRHNFLAGSFKAVSSSCRVERAFT